MKTCETCKFWQNVYNHKKYKSDCWSSAECRKRSPIANDEFNDRVFPHTNDNDWCGDWEKDKNINEG